MIKELYPKTKVKDSEQEESDETVDNKVEEGAENGVKISEEFQIAANKLIDGASKEELDYLSKCASDCKYKMEDEERRAKDKGKEMSVEGMPSMG